YELGLDAPPGTRFRYSDVGFIVLGELVHKIAGRPLNEFAQDHIFTPLGMKDTGFLPDTAHKERAAPCNLRNDQFIQGEVHDPRAYGLGGVAGHAGLFSTADDLSLYVRMILAGGEINKKGILSPLAVRLMTTPREVPTEKTKGLRALGWDVDTAFSSN